MNTTSIFFNHSFDKKKLKAFIYWVLKTFGEKDALTIVEELKRMGFYNATKAGLSIGLNDLKTPSKKKVLISHAQITMNKTDQEFKGAELTATERSQRIIDTWHRTSEDLRKQVVDYFSTYDQLNSVYMMALSGARGNFSQVRQLIGMRGLMADPQGQIISFPIRSNLREGLTLTEYFISCSGARKGLVDTALRTADTGYLTRRLVDISHHIVVKKVTCYTSRGIALKTLRTSHKILLPLKDRLVGRVLGENIYGEDQVKVNPEQSFGNRPSATYLTETEQGKQGGQSKNVIARRNQEISPHLALKISLAKQGDLHVSSGRDALLGKSFASTTQEIENQLDYGKKKASINTPWVLVRSPLTCTYTHELCQLCYGWSMSQGSLVSLGEAVGVLAGQSIGEPGTQLTMRTFHTGGVFSGDLLQEIRAPHSGKIWFPKALQGLLIRTSQGKIAFLIKVSGELLIDSGGLDDTVKKREATKLSLEPSTILFVRQGERVKSNQILAELAITSEEGNQPINSRQTLFSEMRGRIVQWKSMLSRTHIVKGTAKGESLDLGESVALNKRLSDLRSSTPYNRDVLYSNQSRQVPYGSTLKFAGTLLPMTGTNLQKKAGIQAYLGLCKNEVFASAELTQNSDAAKLSERSSCVALPKLNKNEVFVTTFGKATTEASVRKDSILNTSSNNTQALFTERNVQHYEETWGNINNLTLKKIVLSKKHGLGGIEPPKALKLGLLSVIATRIGASEKTCTKVITYNQANQNWVQKTKSFKLQFEQSFNFAKTLNFRKVELKGIHKVNKKYHSSFYNLFSVNPTNSNEINSESVTGSKSRHAFTYLDTRVTCLQHLNTIAEEGDLVDERYTLV